ncbi:MAG: LysM peptidoglycan-binding domain-containing protein [Planctomycetota bacterium]
MAQETKVGLLIGLALILLVGLVLSDLFTGSTPESAEASSRAVTEFGPEAQAGIYDQATPPINPQATGRNGFDRMPGFATDPPQNYGTPTQVPPVESWSPPTRSINPGPADREPTLPELTVEPPSPRLDTLEARDPVARFNQSLEAMRLAIENPIEETPELAAIPSRVEEAEASMPSLDPSVAPTRGTTYIHYVQAGQTLSEIARSYYGNPEFAAAIAETNPTKVDREGQVRAGARLEIPELGSSVFSRLFQPVHEEHAVRIDGAIPALPGRPEGPTAEVPRSSSPIEIEVMPGDTLSELAAEHLGSSRRWQELIDANRDRLTSAAELRSGMKLRIPSAQHAEVEPTLATAVEATPTPQTTRTNVPTTYVVQPGDNLTRIAERLLGDGERWDDLLAANADQLDRPENLQAGMELKLPLGASAIPAPPKPAPAATTTLDVSASPTKTYTVRAGDNLTRIAERELGNGDRWRDLFEANADQLDSPDALFAGQTLRLP